MAAPQVAMVYDGVIQGVQNNKRLSILGNTVLAKVVCTAWIEARDQSGMTIDLYTWQSTVPLY